MLNLQILLACLIPLIITERQRNRCRKTRSDIIEEYHGINEEDKAFMTLYSMTAKFSYLVGKKRKEATQQEKRQLAKQFLDAKNHGLTMRFLILLI